VVHFGTFGVLGGLTWHALAVAHPGRWRWRSAALALLITIAYAISDEFHQSFVPNRTGSPFDVVIDATGAVAVLLGLRWFHSRSSGR